MFKQDNKFGNIFDQKEIRNNFVKKTFGIVGAQLLLTTVLVFIFSYFTMINNLVERFSGIFSLLFIFTSLVFAFSRNLLRNPKTCFISLTFFTFLMSTNLTIFLKDFSLKLIMIGLFSTLTIVSGLIYYAMTTTTAFSTFGALKKVFYFSLLNIFISFFIGSNFIFSFITGIIFGVYLIIDIQMLMGNKELKFTIDDYGFAALNIYLDIINLFIKIMEVLKEDDKKDKRK